MAAAVLAGSGRQLGCPANPGAPLIARSTIAALSSGRLPSAVAVIRISGPQAFEALAHLTRAALPPPRQAALRTLRQPHADVVLDRALVLRFPEPESATGQDVVELHCHGSTAVVAAVLDGLAMLGVRAAEPGEFTRRAFEAGKLDLTQVEGLADLLAATTEAQRVQAVAQADGALRRTSEGWAERLTAQLASLTAQLDFADEEDSAGAKLDRAELSALSEEMRCALVGFRSAERTRDGVVCAIVGAPNVGKSSLFNALVGRDAAIVAATPGTTRDLIEGTIELDGIPVTLIDTAGVRGTADEIEAEGVRRALAQAEAADIVLHVDSGLPRPSRADAIAVQSKLDLGATLQSGSLGVSALTGVGLSALRGELTRRVRRLTRPEEPKLVTRGRQHAAITAALADTEAARTSVEPVLAAEHLSRALNALATLVGRRDVEQILDSVFGRFCIGK